MKVVDSFNSIFLWLNFFFLPEKKNKGEYVLLTSIYVYRYTCTVYTCILCIKWFFDSNFLFLSTHHLWITFRDINIISSKVQGNSMSFHVWFSMKNFKQLSKLISLCNICNCLLLTFIYSHLLCTFMEITCFISPKTCFCNLDIIW